VKVIFHLFILYLSIKNIDFIFFIHTNNFFFIYLSMTAIYYSQTFFLATNKFH